MGTVKLLGGVGGRSSGHPAVGQSSLRRTVQCARSRKRAPRCTGKSVGEVLYQGSNGGGPPPPPELPPTREEDGGDGQNMEQEIDAVLAKAGADASSLPQDIQAAIGTGMASAADIQAYLRAASLPLVGWLCRIFPAFRDRVLGNPRFLLQLAIEEFLGVAGKMTAEVQYRGDRFWKELHFVASDIALEIVGNFFLVWLMSPKVSFKPAATSKLARAVAALPGNVGQTGAFTLNQRLATVLYRGCQFFCVGFVSSVTGHSFTRYLLQQQAAVAVAKAEEEAKRTGKKKADKTPEEQAVAELAPVLDNSLGWAAFMSVNSNLRYQLVNTVEERVIARMVANNALASMMILVMRFCNTAVGGQQWVMFAQAIGLQ